MRDDGRAGTRDSRISGASGSFGVTRYQWPRIIAAKTPPVAAHEDRELDEQRERPERPAAPGERPGGERQRRPPRAARASTEVGDRADATGATRASDGEDDRTASSAARRGTSQAGSARTGEAPSDGRQGPVAQPGEHPEGDRAGGREAEVAARRRRPPTRAARPPRTCRGRDPSGRSS